MKKTYLSFILISFILIGCSASYLCSKYGHSYSFWETIKEPTCIEEGEKQRECTECHHIETDSIPARGHSFDLGVITKQPSCTENGEKTYTCTVCNEIKTEEILAGHSWDDGIISKQATCTENGIKTYTCSVCNEIKTEEIPATGHSKSKYKCSKCGTSFVQINTVGTNVKDSKGLDVTILEWTKTLGTDYDTYFLKYEIKNNVSSSKLTPGTFGIILEDDSIENEYGFFNDLYTGDVSNRTYTWKLLHNQKPILLKYEDTFAFFYGNDETPLYWDMP